MIFNYVNVLGIKVSAINIDIALSVINSWIAAKEHHYVCITGVHGIMESQRDPELQMIHNKAGMVTPDGMPLVWISRMSGFRFVDRVYGPDLMLALCAHSVSKGYRHFFYGGNYDVLEKLCEKLIGQFPGLEIVGTYSPPQQLINLEEDEGVIQLINDSSPDIIWVGLSTPKQEKWMAINRQRLTAPVLIGVGAAFDFNAGLKKQAPKWIQRSGFEWLFRLMTEPGRLWRRYLVNNPAFILLFLAQTLKVKSFPIEQESNT